MSVVKDVDLEEMPLQPLSIFVNDEDDDDDDLTVVTYCVFT